MKLAINPTVGHDVSMVSTCVISHHPDSGFHVLVLHIFSSLHNPRVMVWLAARSSILASSPQHPTSPHMKNA